MTDATFIELRQIIAACRNRHRLHGDFSDAEIELLLFTGGSNEEDIRELMYYWNE